MKNYKKLRAQKVKSGFFPEDLTNVISKLPYKSHVAQHESPKDTKIPYKYRI